MASIVTPCLNYTSDQRRNMPIINLSVDLAELQFAVIDAMRGKMPREDYLRFCLEVGLVRVMDEALRTTTERQFQYGHSITDGYSGAKHLFRTSGSEAQSKD